MSIIILLSIFQVISFFLWRRSGNIFLRNLYLPQAFLLTLIHEFGHGLVAKLFFNKIDNIFIHFFNFNRNIQEYGCCTFTKPNSRLVSGLVSYSGHLAEALTIVVGGYLFGTGQLQYFYFLFMILFILYTYYGRRLIDKVTGLLLSILFGGVALGRIVIGNSETMISYFSLIILGLLIGGSIIHLIELYKGVENNENSDATLVWKNLFIPKFITILSWIFLLVSSILLTLSFITGNPKVTHIEYIDSKIGYVHQFLDFKYQNKYENTTLTNSK